jgi:hypothetical protein
MALAPRSSVPLSTVFVSVISVIAASPAVRAASSGEPTRITAVANVTLRAAPSPTASAIAQLPLGTEVRDSGPAGLDKTWVLVRLGDAREGWIQSRLTRTLDPVWRWPVFDAIIAERLDRKGDGFSALVELVSFIERVEPEYTNKDGRAHIELARLRALSRAAAAIPFQQARRDPYAAWLTLRAADVVYDEPGGRWMVRDAAIWDTHKRHAATTVADDIAWFAVTNGVAGECEGTLSCYFAVIDRRHGQYLRAHPAGRRASEAVAAVSALMNSVAPSGVVNTRYAFDRATGCRELVPAVEGLASAIQTSKAVGWDGATANLTTIRRLCP